MGKWEDKEGGGCKEWKEGTYFKTEGIQVHEIFAVQCKKLKPAFKVHSFEHKISTTAPMPSLTTIPNQPPLFYLLKKAESLGVSWSGYWVSGYHSFDLESMERKQENTHFALGTYKKTTVLFFLLWKAPVILISSCLCNLFIARLVTY
jgi:hypothetical protein